MNKEILNKLREDLEEIERDILGIIDDVEYYDTRKNQYERLLGKRSYIKELIEYLESKGE